MLSSANAAYILPGTHTVKLQYNRPGGGGSVGPVELHFEAAAGKEYREPLKIPFLCDRNRGARQVGTTGKTIV
jgi:hypothetical protein